MSPDNCESVEVILSLERKELRRYSVWEQEEMEAQNLRFQGSEEPCPAAVLMFCVSETAADAIQQELRHLCVKDGTPNTGEEDSEYKAQSYFESFRAMLCLKCSYCHLLGVHREGEPLYPADSEKSSGGNGGGFTTVAPGH